MVRSNKILFIIEEELQVQVRGYKMTKILDGKEVGSPCDIKPEKTQKH